MLRTRAALAAAAAALVGGCGFAGAGQQTEGSVCAEAKVQLPADAVALSDGVMIPLVIDVTTEDLSQLPTSTADTPEEVARGAALAIYRERAGTIATVAGLPAARVANVQDKVVLQSLLPPDAASWQFTGRLVLLVRRPEQACALGTLPEVRRVISAIDLVERGEVTMPPAQD